jgi:hypothetical protein
MQKRSRLKKNVDEKKEPSLYDPPFISKWSYGWVPFPYQGEYLGETQILTYLQNNIPRLEKPQIFQVFNWSCELLQIGKIWVVKSNNRIILRRCILCSHKCKECNKVYFLPWPFNDWSDPELANFCYPCRKNLDKGDLSEYQKLSSGNEVGTDGKPVEAITFNSISVEK